MSTTSVAESKAVIVNEVVSESIELAESNVTENNEEASDIKRNLPEGDY